MACVVHLVKTKYMCKPTFPVQTHVEKKFQN